MNATLKNNLRRILTGLPVYRTLKNELEYRKWKNQQQTSPSEPVPHRVKQQLIATYQQKYGCKVLVETGTYLGDMIVAQRNNFEMLYSIELSPELHRRAVHRFRKNPRIRILQGDSGQVLPVLLKEITQPALFWLDGHYSAGITARGSTECPIFEELEAIFSCGIQHPVVLIDDARCYTGTGDYPSLEELRAYLAGRASGYTMEVGEDVVRVCASHFMLR